MIVPCPGPEFWIRNFVSGSRLLETDPSPVCAIIFPFNETADRNEEQTNLTILFYFKNKDLQIFFVAVFFWIHLPGSCILHINLHRKKKRLRERYGWSTPLELYRTGWVGAKKDDSKRAWTSFQYNHNISSRKSIFKNSFEIQARKEIWLLGVYFIAGLFFFLVLNIHTRASGPLQFVFQVKERTIPTCLSK